MNLLIELMFKLYSIIYYVLLSCLLLPASCFFSTLSAGTYASDTWALVKKYIAVHPGTSKAVWEDADRSLITNGAMEMTPVGDGTYQAILELNKGATYNFIFFAKTEASAPPGLQTWTTYYDAVPTGGSIQSGTQPTVVTTVDTYYNPVYYSVIVDGYNQDARRVLKTPTNIGDTLYIFNNFGDHPKAPQNFKANALDTQNVLLTWDDPYTNWGTWGESVKAVDVIAGGTYAIYRNTTGSTTTYTLLTTVDGSLNSYYDTNVAMNDTYWYVIVSYDAYRGGTNQPFTQLCSSDTSNQDSATIYEPINVFFKVEHFNWDYVRQHDYIVYLTPDTEQNLIFARRIMGRIAVCEIRN
ncbi:MAG: hypothetical protein AB1765_07415 [Candidatus Hydrogenedentota bacterium]